MPERTNIPPLHDWHRHQPTARRIAAGLLDDAALLALRTTTLVADIRERFGVAHSTAMAAVSLARNHDPGGVQP